MDIWGVSNSEMKIFVQGQGNQANARRRTLVRRTSNLTIEGGNNKTDRRPGSGQ
jgi:hypothetical protein